MDFIAFLIALILHIPTAVAHPEPTPPPPPAKHHAEAPAPEPTEEPSDEPSVGDDDSDPTECVVLDENDNELGPCDGTFYFD